MLINLQRKLLLMSMCRRWFRKSWSLNRIIVWYVNVEHVVRHDCHLSAQQLDARRTHTHTLISEYVIGHICMSRTLLWHISLALAWMSRTQRRIHHLNCVGTLYILLNVNYWQQQMPHIATFSSGNVSFLGNGNRLGFEKRWKWSALDIR